MKSLGARIRELRESRNVSLRSFARQLNRSPSYISDIELDHRQPSAPVLAAIARLLKVSIEELRVHDPRVTIEALKGLIRRDPKFALALRTVIDQKLTADELLQLLAYSKRN